MIKKDVVDSVRKEHNELVNKMNALTSFLNEDHPEVDGLSRGLLIMQASIMQSYANVLRLRLNVIESTEDVGEDNA